MTHLAGHVGCENGHVCQRPSGRSCYEKDCSKTAGTKWGPMWCPDHDSERLERVNRQMVALLEKLDNATYSEDNKLYYGKDTEK